MNKTLPNILRSIIVGVLGFAMSASTVHAAASLQFDRTVVSVDLNATFQLNVRINVDSATALGSDAIINYAGADLEVTSVTNGGFFPEFNSANNTTGRLELHGYTSASNDSRTGNGTLASIVFKAKKGSGSSAIAFICSGSGNDTNILTTSGQNILTCTQTNTAGITYTGAITNTATPTPTSAVTATPSPTPGGSNTSPSCSSLYADKTLAVGTPLAVTFVCAGADPGGYLNAAEFVYGDGTSQIVEHNAGSPGSIGITHTYTTIGTLGASRRVRDNDGVWSQTPSDCKKIITIKQNPSPTPLPIQYSQGSGTSRVTPTPTRTIAAIVSDTPEPTITPSPEPTIYPETLNSSTTDQNQFWWIIGGVIAIILAFLLLRRK